jgi:hypothetical protein
MSMDVEIGEVVTTVKAVDGSTLASPDVMRQIVKAVLRAVQDQQAHAGRVRAERRVTGGVAEERDAED